MRASRSRLDVRVASVVEGIQTIAGKRCWARSFNLYGLDLRGHLSLLF
jgi:hypothetical protein